LSIRFPPERREKGYQMERNNYVAEAEILGEAIIAAPSRGRMAS